MSVIRLSNHTERRWGLIHAWQVNTTEDSVEKQLPLAAQRYKLIIQLYKQTLKLLCFEKDHDVNQRRLKRAFETLLLWGQQYEVSVGELDKLIDRSWRLRRSVLKTLTNIGQILTDRLTPHIQQPLPKQLQEPIYLLREAREEAVFLIDNNVESEHISTVSGDNDSDTSSTFESDSLSEIAEDLMCNVEVLIDLDGLYDAAKEATDLYEKEPAAKAVASLASASSPAAKVYTEIIQRRFPEANYELLDSLGKASYYRFVRSSRQRKENEDQAKGDSELRDYAAATVDERKFHDSGVGTSVCSGSYAETIMSFNHENGRVVRIPPLPEEGKKGLPFLCIACGKSLVICSNKAWKRHLFSDLEPYNCLETSCRYAVKPLGGREDWVEHLAVHYSYGDQWQSFQCGLCLEDTGQGEANVTIHLERHLQDIALTALPNNVVDGSESESDVATQNSGILEEGKENNRPSFDLSASAPESDTPQDFSTCDQSQSQSQGQGQGQHGPMPSTHIYNDPVYNSVWGKPDNCPDDTIPSPTAMQDLALDLLPVSSPPPPPLLVSPPSPTPVIPNKLRLFSCNICSHSFRYKKDLNRHMDSVHRTWYEPVYRCKCGKIDTRKKNYLSHLRRCNGIHADQHYTCKCNSVFTDNEEHIAHLAHCPDTRPTLIDHLSGHTDA
ncbi:hypothetical protein F5Y10DRAFT_239145 [Nemania abortiva]|nr:hypothetical protein F5Y10DRAFT_239145 [Nemania abortiva]